MLRVAQHDIQVVSPIATQSQAGEEMKSGRAFATTGEVIKSDGQDKLDHEENDFTQSQRP
jgi:hypothetical protein